MGQHYLDPVQYILSKDNESPITIQRIPTRKTWMPSCPAPDLDEVCRWLRDHP